MRLEVTDPVPKFISRQWRGYGEQAREALIRHTTLVAISCMYFLSTVHKLAQLDFGEYMGLFPEIVQQIKNFLS